MNEPKQHSIRGRVLRLTIAGLSLAAVVAVSLWESEERISPGALHPSHEALPELRGKVGCATCHGGILASMTESCLECHDPIAAQLEAGTGLHGKLASETARACDDCHSEHTGGTIALVDDRSFVEAGVTDIGNYRHEHIASFALTDRHEALDCEHCHPNAHAELIIPGESRYLGLSQTCTACHDDTHDGSHGPDCASCHGQAHSFTEAPLFEHDEAFVLTGSHADLGCALCHPSGTDHAVAALLNRPLDTRACAECHESPHRDRFLSEIAAAEHVTQAESCETCHDPVHSAFAGTDTVMTAAFHAATGFRLEPPHDTQQCIECHPGRGEEHADESAAIRARFAVMFPGRAQDDCRACHEDPHRGEFDTGFSKGACLTCHTETHFTPTRFDAAFHTRTGFALTGAHASVTCKGCHIVSEKEGRFLPVERDCAACHEDAHRGRLTVPASIAANKNEAPDCGTCHTTESFSAEDWTVSDHAAWTAFPLQGAHALTDCLACHLPSNTPTLEGRLFGFAERNCSACHADTHAGQFAVAGVVDCARCHSAVETWTMSSFDHQRDSRFKLDEHHVTLECAACHRPADTGRGRMVVRYKPLGIECADCHGFQGAKGVG